MRQAVLIAALGVMCAMGSPSAGHSIAGDKMLLAFLNDGAKLGFQAIGNRIEGSIKVNDAGEKQFGVKELSLKVFAEKLSGCGVSNLTFFGSGTPGYHVTWFCFESSGDLLGYNADIIPVGNKVEVSGFQSIRFVPRPPAFSMLGAPRNTNG